MSETKLAEKQQRNNRRQQSERTRKKLLEVSLRLFVHKGYAGTTVRDIATETGVSPGLMFHYFPSKQAILEEHVRIVESGVESVVNLLASGEKPLETVARIAEMILTSFSDVSSRYLFLLASQILSLESIPAEVRQKVSASKSIQASVPLIMLGQQRGEIRQGDPMALAVAFWGALQGIAEVLVWNPEAPIPEAECLVRILAA